MLELSREEILVEEKSENWCAGHNTFVAAPTYHCMAYSDFCKQIMPTALCVECAASTLWRHRLKAVKYWYNIRLLSEVYLIEQEEDLPDDFGGNRYE